LVVGLLSAGLAAGSIASIATISPAKADLLPYQDTSLPFSVRAADLVSRMTLQEKQQQLRAQTQTNAASGLAPAIPRLGVPAYDYWNEALHGVARSSGGTNSGLATDFPTGIALASSWNRDLVHAAETAVSDEARAYSNYYNTGVSAAYNKGLTYWSPTINMHRDPRWGRAEETYGEDQYLTAQIGEQFVLGLQGDFVTPEGGVDTNSLSSEDGLFLKAIATPKHFLAQNSENTRHEGSANVTEAELREYYSYQFRHVLRPEVGAKSYMTAYSHLNITDGNAYPAYGVDTNDSLPMSANYPVQVEMVKRTWGFEGVSVSDCDAIRDSWDPRMGGYRWVPADVQALGNLYNWTGTPSYTNVLSWDQYSGIAYTLKLGTDLDCMDNDYNSNVTGYGVTSTANVPAGENGLAVSVANGYASEADLDIAVTRAFTMRMQTGEFDNGGRDNAAPASGTQSPLYANTPWAGLTLANTVDSAAHRKLAKQAAAEATVLLKNNGILPLAQPTAAKKYVVVGHMAAMAVHGDYSPATSNDYSVSAIRALMEYISDAAGTPLALDDPTTSAVEGQVTYIPGFDMTGKWAWKKTDLGVNGKVVLFLDGSGNEIGSISAEELIRSGTMDGWRGVQPWGVNYSTLTSIGAWGGHFEGDWEIPAGTVSIAVSQSATPGTGYTNPSDPTSTCYPVAGWPGELTVSVGARYSGTEIGTVPAGLDEVCDDNPAWTYTPGNCFVWPGYGLICWPAASVAGSVPITETTAGSVAALAGQTVHLNFEYSTDFGYPTFTPAEEQIIADADVVIAYAGTTAMQSMCATNPSDPGADCTGGTSAASDSSEDEDRATLDLPRYQDIVIKRAAQLNPNTIAWMQTVSQVNVEPFINGVAAAVWTSYNGQSQSRNLADVLFGNANPSGHLTFTWYQDDTQLPLTTDYQMTPDANHNGRTYQYFTGDVRYPFGYGLSYSKFEYSDLTIDKSAVTPDDTIKATVTVKNAGTVKGKEVVQLYVVGPKASDPLRPDEQLKGFEKVELNPGQSKKVSIELPISDLWFWDSGADKQVYDTGAWQLYVGPNSDLGACEEESFTLSGSRTPAVDIVTALPDGVILHTETPGNVIHANLSATRNDETFYDLFDEDVAVEYSSSDESVAKVDAVGTVSPVAAGTALITAKVTADNSSKSTTFPVVVVTGTIAAPAESASDAIANPAATLFETLVDFPSVTITTAQAAAGYQLDAQLVGVNDDTSPDTFTYLKALGEENSANATVSATGLVTATDIGKVRVTVSAYDGAKFYAQTATVQIVTDPQPINDSVAAADAVVRANFTEESLAVLDEAVAAAKAALLNPNLTEGQVAALAVSIDNAVKALKVKDPATPVKEVPDTKTQISTAKLSAGWRVWTGGHLAKSGSIKLNGKKLVEGTDYDVIAAGTNTNIGIGTVTISGKGAFTGEKTLTFKIVPKKISITKASAGKGQVTLKWNKATAAQKITGYQVQYQMKGSKTKVTKTYKSSVTSTTLKKLKKGKAYRILVRAYKTVNGVKYYSSWSGPKTTKKVK
jgi:beta-glucosidase